MDSNLSCIDKKKPHSPQSATHYWHQNTPQPANEPSAQGLLYLYPLCAESNNYHRATKTIVVLGITALFTMVRQLCIHDDMEEGWDNSLYV